MTYSQHYKEETDHSNQIYISITSDHPEIFQKIQKNAAYINHLLEKQIGSQFYLEIIENGLLYIYNDLTIFEMLNQPFSSRQVIRFSKQSKKFDEIKSIFPFYLNEKSFPKAGIKIFFHTISKPKEKIISIGQNHFKSLFGDRVSIDRNKKGDLILHFHNFYDYSLYLALLASLLAGIFKKIPERKEKQKRIQQITNHASVKK
ncbi:MAG: hypothetical protein K9W44_03870 [Candidatus Lokiarchaeota archaeon]|nr:hypothetical protein [Candidatus Harpocratesius repetitus]